MGALTWTEEALTAGKLDTATRRRSRSRRSARATACREGRKFVEPEDEGALVAATEREPLIYANKLADATSDARAADKKCPDAPGLAAARCDLALRQGDIDAARAACQRALAIDPDESWALYLSGDRAQGHQRGGTKAGIEKLKHAITVDPDLGQAWRALGKAYDRAKDQAALEQLAEEYPAKFEPPLPQ